MPSIPFSVISFSHIIYLIKKGFEIIGECLCMVINIELGSVNTSGGLVIRPWPEDKTKPVNKCNNNNMDNNKK